MSTLLFVNKDAKSTSFRSSRGDERTSINAHVQRGRKHLRRVKMPISLDGQRQKLLEFRVRGLATSATTSGEDIDSPRLGPESSDDESKDLLGERTPTWATVSGAAPKSWQLSKLHPKPQTLLGQGYVDPFDSIVFALQASGHNFVQSYQANFLLGVWSAEASTKSRALANAAWNGKVKDIIADDSGLHALIASALTFKAIMLTDAKSKSEAQSQALKHKTLSMKALRRRLADGVAESTAIPVVYQLAVTEYLSGNLGAHFTHIDAVRRLVENIGGLRMIPWALQREIVIMDLLFALRMRSRPYFASEDWDPGPWSRQFVGKKYVAPHLPDMTAIHAEIPADVARDFEAQREWFAVKTLVAMPIFDAEDDTPDHIHDWLHVRRYCLASRLMHRYADMQRNPLSSNRSSLSSDDGAAKAALKACTALALIFGGSFIREPSRYYVSLYVPFYHLRTLVEEQLLPSLLLVAGASEGEEEEGGGGHRHHIGFGHQYSNWTMWLFFIGALEEELFAAQREPPTPTTRWFSTRFLEQAAQLQLTTWEQAETRLAMFLYKTDPLRPFLQALFGKRDWLLLMR